MFFWNCATRLVGLVSAVESGVNSEILKLKAGDLWRLIVAVGVAFPSILKKKIKKKGKLRKNLLFYILPLRLKIVKLT